MPQSNDARTEAKRYLDDAITRHRENGDSQRVPRAVYDRALSRTTRTVREFERIERKANSR
jgi:hypothetical protein